MVQEITDALIEEAAVQQRAASKSGSRRGIALTLDGAPVHPPFTLRSIGMQLCDPPPPPPLKHGNVSTQSELRLTGQALLYGPLARSTGVPGRSDTGATQGVFITMPTQLVTEPPRSSLAAHTT